MADQPLHPGDLVGEFVRADRVAVGQVERGDANLAAIRSAEAGFDIARLLVLVGAGQAAGDIARRLLREQRDAVISALPDALDPIAERLDFEPREVVAEAFYFLQAQDVGFRALQKIEEVRQPYLDRI